MAERTTLVHARGGEEPAGPDLGAPALSSPAPEAGPGGFAGCVYGLLLTARPRQWIKNLLVVAAPAAAGQLASVATAARLALVFALFTAAASAVYLLNDARDAEADRAHPDKCRRPVAAGTVPVGLAYAAGGVLAPASAASAALLCNTATAALLAGYVAMQVAYCLLLKRILVVDLAVVTAGFVMRAMCGGLALGIPLSRWFLITAGFGALFMVAAKRYSEALLVGEGEGETRALLREYTVGYLRFVWQLAAGAAVLAYCLWALESDGGGSSLWRQLSMVPLILAVLRYAVFADRGAAGSPEDVLLRDRPLGVTGLCWGLLYGLSVAGL
ncbi:MULTISPECIES: decaprenyl-phosphate phosphoribosyltransferase [unclassified Streptomyces]|uniref:decaprenyl-phosphate phosphoribosyltransferase n=1 Tax=unclassified Streptomyces TaxID=2593676 RepID=UPI002DDA70F8|nr:MULTISPECIES: decaprenyl-phosphate phosphoribosyltransferase [unclassified Streptomyces]WSA94408.1 decaprenyl-phosphate phosphoribosyltransferase [Streptomyces sp. NBC_01795]WSB78826.1 decaprenyl-phosphate phosphoribosyltransferase [Streptomyces sp. NBC_01775]WSS12971.1 decaprenyl-phosphate phosphoribosyltransferase [Streptomyces sp. NBC_01186]WSS41754.1 decaprenyl-phosphate phosphoribosyltransferase [Streptomyces sp. NBC_01187]